METVKILHCADMHIGAAVGFLEERSENRRKEVLLTFEKIINMATENQVDFLLIAGDLFDSNAVENSFAESVTEQIKAASPLRVIYCAGNHDPYNPRSPFALKKTSNLYILGSEETVISFPELNTRIYGRSFETAFLKGRPALEIIPENDGVINICVLHGELTSDINSRYNAITNDFIASSNMDYIALGHIHKRSEIAKLGDTYFAYSGCPEGQGFDELGEKGVYLGEVGKNHCDLKFLPTAKRLHIHEKIDITDVEDNISAYCLKLLQKKYGDSFCDNLYKIELTGSLSSELIPDFSDISAHIKERVYYAKLINSTKALIDYESLSKEQSLKGIFVKKMLQKIENSAQDEREILENALKIGLSAFQGEVNFNDN